MTSRTQQARTASGNDPPANNSLLPGQIYLELADPMRIWCGVPTSINPNGVRLIFDAQVASQAINKTGDTVPGLINFSGGINVTNTPSNVPLAAQDTNTLQAASTSWVLGQADSTNPLANAPTAAPGSRTRWSRGDHVHPTDATRAPLASPALTGTPSTTTPPVDDNSTRISNTQWVMGQAASTPPLMDGPPTPGVATRWARADHVHPSDTTRGVVVVGDAPPANPNPGTFWFDSVGVQLYLYYQDATSSQWVPANNQALAGFLALSGGVMQGPITLAGDGAAPLQPATARQLLRQNYVDNSGFTVNQRGYASGAALAAGAYGFDRWKAGASGATLTFTNSPPATLVNITAGSLVQIIEGANLLGQPYTLSWAGTASGRAYSGTPGAFTASPIQGTLTAGTNLTIEFGAGTLGQVQLELGSVVTVWQPQPVQVELARCQRFWVGTMTSYCGGAGAGDRTTFVFPVTMRAAPTMNYIFSSSINVVGVNLINADIYGWTAAWALGADSAWAGSLLWNASTDL